MKKSLLFLFLIMLTVLTILPASANDYAAKDIKIDEKGIYVLTESSNLKYVTDVLDTEADVLYTGVREFSIYNDGDQRTTILFNNGNIEITGKNIKETIKTNAIKLVEFRPDNGEYAFIDTKGTLHLRKLNSSIDLALLENAKECYVNGQNMLVLTKDNTLYRIDDTNQWKLETKYIKSQKLLTDIVKVYRGSDYSVFVRKNGDIISYSEADGAGDIQIVGSALKNFDETNIFVNKKGNEVYYIDSENILKKISIDKVTNTVEIAEEIKSIFGYQSGSSTNIFALDFNNTLTKLHGNHLDNDYKIKNVAKLIGDSIQFYLGTDGWVYSAVKTDVKPYIYEKYSKNIQKFMRCSEGNLSLREDYIMFITNAKEIYGAKYTQGNGKNHVSEKFPTAFTSKKTRLVINNKTVELETNVQIKDDRSMYPFRECLEAMGATVIWDAVNRIAIGEYKKNTVKFPIDDNYYYINNTKHMMDTCAYIDPASGKTFIPIRYAAEGLGFTVGWTAGKLENVISISE